MEQWKNIDGHNNLYEVSNYGNVRNKQTGRVLVGDINNCGYRRVQLSNPSKKYFVHKLVALYFCHNDDITSLIVNHIDGNKLNNNAENLEWVTPSENSKHAFAMGLRFPTQYNGRPCWKIRIFDLATNETIGIYQDKYAFAKAWNRSTSSVSEIMARGYFYERARTHVGRCYGIEWIKKRNSVVVNA